MLRALNGRVKRGADGWGWQQYHVTRLGRNSVREVWLSTAVAEIKGNLFAIGFGGGIVGKRRLL